MSYNIQFNRNSGMAMAQTLSAMSKELEQDTVNMLAALKRLHEYYKDESYDIHSTNIMAIINAMSDTCESFNNMSKAISDYTIKLFG